MLTNHSIFFDSSHNQEIYIRDIVILSYNNQGKSIRGEFDIPANPGEVQSDVVQRLYDSIVKLVSVAADIHLEENCNEKGELKKESKNVITRLMTSEFFFYTSEPLSKIEFEKLQQSIFNWACKQPQNLHLVLGTFAILTQDNKVMNVVSHIECGVNPRIHLSVKNNPSVSDPVYGNKELVFASNHKLENEGILINNKYHSFTFKNVYKCKTAGGSEFWFCDEICLDHFLSTGYQFFYKKLYKAANKEIGDQSKFLPILCSHAVLSFTCTTDPEKSFGVVTHADPFNFNSNCKNGSTVEKFGPFNLSFGSPAFMVITNHIACNKLPFHQMEMVNAHNGKLFFKTMNSKFKNIQNEISTIYLDDINLVIIKLENAIYNKDMPAITEILNIINDNLSETLTREIVSKLLCKSILFNDVGIVREFLSFPHDINTRSYFHTTPLIMATRMQNIEIVKLLQEKNADPGITDIYGNFALDFAIESGQLELIHTILSYTRNFYDINQCALQIFIIALRNRNRIYSLLDFAKDEDNVIMRFYIAKLLTLKTSQGFSFLEIAALSHDNISLFTLRHLAENDPEILFAIHAALATSYNCNLLLQEFMIKICKIENVTLDLERLINETGKNKKSFSYIAKASEIGVKFINDKNLSSICDANILLKNMLNELARFVSINSESREASFFTNFYKSLYKSDTQVAQKLINHFNGDVQSFSDSEIQTLVSGSLGGIISRYINKNKLIAWPKEIINLYVKKDLSKEADYLYFSFK